MMSLLQNVQVAFSYVTTLIKMMFEIKSSGAPGLCFVSAAAPAESCR